MLLGVDVGGTFTDAALLAGERLHTAKVPTTPGDQSRGVVEAISDVLDRAGANTADLRAFTHGMTVGTNALLEERGARTALIATRGFADLLEIGRQNRPSLYRPCRSRPEPLVERDLRFEAAERIGPDGVISELEAAEVERLVEAVRSSGAESVAVCLLFAFRDPGSRAPDRRGAARGAAGRPRVGLLGGAARLPRVRALLDHRDRRLPLPPARRATSAGSPRPAASAACPSRR